MQRYAEFSGLECGDVMIARYFPVLISFSLAACAVMPEPTPESILSYAEIVQQIECEMFYAVQDLEDRSLLDVATGSQANAWADLDHWAFTVDIKPQNTFDAQLNVASGYKSRDGDRYVQWALGGPGATGANYEGKGVTVADNAYNINVLSLFTPESRTTFPHQLNTHIKCSAEPGQRDKGTQGGALNEQIPHMDFLNGVYGIHEYLKRTLAAAAPLGTEPSTITLSKEYYLQIQAGVTAGWYVALGNTSPGIGGSYLIDDTITLTFTPPARPAVQAAGVERAHAGVRARVPGWAVPVSPSQSQSLFNNRALFSTQQLLNKLETLPPR